MGGLKTKRLRLENVKFQIPIIMQKQKSNLFYVEELGFNQESNFKFL